MESKVNFFIKTDWNDTVITLVKAWKFEQFCAEVEDGLFDDWKYDLPFKAPTSNDWQMCGDNREELNEEWLKVEFDVNEDYDGTPYIDFYAFKATDEEVKDVFDRVEFEEWPTEVVRAHLSMAWEDEQDEDEDEE